MSVEILPQVCRLPTRRLTKGNQNLDLPNSLGDFRFLWVVLMGKKNRIHVAYVFVWPLFGSSRAVPFFESMFDSGCPPTRLHKGIRLTESCLVLNSGPRRLYYVTPVSLDANWILMFDHTQIDEQTCNTTFDVVCSHLNKSRTPSPTLPLLLYTRVLGFHVLNFSFEWGN